jgi:hypothetical protein
MKASNLSSFLSFAITNTFPVLITGKPGIGKSDIVAQACESAKAKLIISHPVVSDPTDYKGLPFAGTDNVAHFMPFGELNELITAKEKTVFFLDDLGQAPVSVQAACMQLILARRINGHKVSDNVVFVAATNRKQDRAGVSGLLEPVKSRFASIVSLDVDTTDWCVWALNNNMPIELIAFIKFKPEFLDMQEPTKDIINSASPRTIANVGKLQNAQVDKRIETEVFIGAAGEKFALQYVEFLKTFRELPSIEEIILNPTKARISDQPGVLYALAGLLSANINEQNFDAISTYMERLPAEIAVCTIKFALARKPQLATTKSFISWSVKYGNAFMKD